MPCDYKNYPVNWKTEIRPAILDRAGQACEVCGVLNGKTVLRGVYNDIEVYQDENGTIYDASNSEAIADDYVGEVDQTMKNKFIKIVLTVAHLDHDTSNNNYSNLKALCQLHHLRHDIGHHKQSRKKKRGLQNLF